MSSTDLPLLLQRFTARYRAALLTKTGLLAALGLALAAVLAWRLFMLRLVAGWRLGVPAAVAVVTGASLVWWAHSRWPSRRASAAYLDRLLGLKQRLVTAEEFANAPNAPALYPLLVADASKWVADGRTRYPRPLDRTAAVLFALLLLALAWPLGGRSPLQQLAQLPRPPIPPMKPPEPPQTPPPLPQNRAPQQQQGGVGQQPSTSSSAGSQGQQGQSQSQSAGRDQTSQSPSGQNQQQETRGSEGSSNNGGAKSADNASGGERGQGQSGHGQGQQQSSGSQLSSQSGSSQSAAGSAQAKQAQSAAGQSASGDAQGGAQDGTQGAAQQARASAGGKSGGDAQAGAGNGRSVEAKAARAPSGGGSSGSPGNEALQQDIQRLLKDVSGEIQTLQAQIAAAKGQPPPTAGTATDPELYGAPEPLGQTGAGTIPIQLKTDTAATTSGARAGSGVGRPSGEVTAAAPSATPEPAQLSDDPLEEPPGSRDTVPPEYRDVFDRLNHRPQPSETTP